MPSHEAVAVMGMFENIITIIIFIQFTVFIQFLT